MEKIKNIIHQSGILFEKLIEKYKTIDLSFSKKNIIIFLTDDKCYISAYYQEKLLDYILIEKTEYKSNEHKKFLEKYKQYKIFFVLDYSAINLDHIELPVSQALTYHNPIKKFIATKFPKETLVSSNVYNITLLEQEIWHTIFASCEIDAFLQELLDYTIYENFKINGIYFLPLNIPTLVDAILIKLSLPKPIDSLMIFVSVTFASQIRITVIDGYDIISNHILEYDKTKPETYIQGIIEQGITDCLISLKNHIHHHQVKPSLIIVSNQKVKSLLETSKIDIENIILLSPENFNLKSYKIIQEELVTDQIISYFLNKKTSYHATNELIGNYNNINTLNNFLSKPFYFIISIMIIILLNIGINIFIKDNRAHDLNEKFYLLSEDYRKSRKEYPNISGLEQVVNFYYATEELSKKQILPWDVLDQLITMQSKNFVIDKIHWEAGYNNKSYLICNLRYKSQENGPIKAHHLLDQEIQNLKNSLPNSTIKYNYDENQILNSGGYTTIPLNIIITH